MKLKLAIAAGASWLALTGTAYAQEDPRDALIRELAARLEAVEAQLGELKESSAADVADIRRIQAEAPQVTLANARPQLTMSDGSARFAIRGLIQFDAASYSQDPGRPVDLASGTNFRRARLGVEGAFSRSWNYALTGEFGGSATESAGLNQAWVEYAGWKPWTTNQAQPMRFRIGAWATPNNLEDATNNAESLFLERAASSELARGIAGGDGRSGAGVLLNGDRWYAHAVYTGPTVGAPATPESDEQSGYLLRAAWLASRSPSYAIHLGANVNGVIEPADTNLGAGVTKQVRLRERPELRVDGNRFVDTGNIAADGVVQYGVELGGFYKNFYGAAEAFEYTVDRTAAGLDDASFSGWYVQGAWTLTKEQRQWVSNTGGFRGVRPANVFDPRAGTWGAIELAARYSILDLNHNEGLAGVALPAGGIRGGEQTITTIGLNWYPNQVARFLLDYQWVEIDRLNNAGAQIGEDFSVVSLRSQVSF